MPKGVPLGVGSGSIGWLVDVGVGVGVGVEPPDDDGAGDAGWGLLVEADDVGFGEGVLPAGFAFLSCGSLSTPSELGSMPA